VRNDIHIIDLQKALKCLNEACDFLRDLSSSDGRVLFVGTKRQAQQVIVEEAERCGAFYVNQRWLGGTLTNFATIRKAISRLLELEEKEREGFFYTLSKKEASRFKKEKDRLSRLLSGIKDLEELPSALYIVDPAKEKIALSEARKVGIPVVAIVDTNADPDLIDYCIPGNDDAIRAVRLITACIADAIIEGREQKEEGEAEPAKEMDTEDLGEERENED
jgi:small subunit ribosomal protein S2